MGGCGSIKMNVTATWEVRTMSEHDNHGQTPAAWTAVIIMMFAFLWGGLGLILGQSWMFWSAFGIFILGIIVGKGMQMAGLGAVPREHESAATTE